MTRGEIEQILERSLKELFKRDLTLLQNDVSERAITHKLAEYLQDQIFNAGLDLNVDCEYNRDVTQGDYSSKTLSVPTKEELRKAIKRGNFDEVTSISTYPDIIVHERGSNAKNLLVIEVKKKNSSVSSDHDYRKLKAFTNSEPHSNFRYKYGVFVCLGTRKQEPGKPELHWFIEGAEQTVSNNI